MQQQKRGGKIAMTSDELDAYLRSERTCTVATIGLQGPHASALWFVWDGTSMWLYSITRSQRWTNLERDPRVSVLVEAGEGYMELRGAELLGSVEQVGEVPRTGEAVRRARGTRTTLGREVRARARRPSRVAPAHAAQDRELGLPQARAGSAEPHVKIAWREIHAGVRDE